jgi:hypothetical protein
VTAALAAALRACAAGLYHGEAGTELLIRHGAFLRRDDFSAFISEGTSITDGATPMASIDWETAIAALNAGNLPASTGERSVLQLAASIAAGTPVALRDTITSLDSANLELLLTAVRHAAGHRPR